MGTHPRASWRVAGPALGHEDCNGRMPNIAKEVFTKMGDRRGHGEDEEEEVDYVSATGSPGWAKEREKVPRTGGGWLQAGLEWEGQATAAAKEHKRAWQRRTGLQATEQGVGWSRSWERRPLSCCGWGEGLWSCWEVQRSSSSPSLLDGWGGQR